MALEKTVKDLQTQHAQFQETLLNLAKGQQEMMALLVTKKKTKKRVVILNMGRRFKGPARLAQIEEAFPEEEEDNQEEEARCTRARDNQATEDEGYSEEQYHLRMKNTNNLKTELRLWKSKKCLV